MIKSIKHSLFIVLFVCFGFLSSCLERPNSAEFHVTFSKSLSHEAVSGRLFVFLDDDLEGNPIGNEKIFFAKDVLNWKPGEIVVLDWKTMGFPYSLDKLPVGRYNVQALLDRNEQEWGFLEARGNLYNKSAILDISSGIQLLHLDKTVQEKTFKETNEVKEIRIPSDLLSRFYKHTVVMEAAVILPPGYCTNLSKRYPVVYILPGYGGRHFHIAEGDWNQNRYAMNKIGLDKIFVYVDHDCPLGYHCFVDSENNGPVGRAFVEEFLPSFESLYRIIRQGHARLLMGQSSGAWASMWLQVNYPDLFGGAWAVSPDPVDFRNFLGVNLYEPDIGVFFNQLEELRPLILIDGQVILTWKERVQQEQILGPGGWLETFEAQFSPKGIDGNPAKLWDRDTGKLNPLIIEHWKRYDLRLFIEKNRSKLKSPLRNKLFIFVADDDDVGLDNSIRLFQSSLKELGYSAFVKILSEGGHGDGVWKQVIGEIHEQMDKTILLEK